MSIEIHYAVMDRLLSRLGAGKVAYKSFIDISTGETIKLGHKQTKMKVNSRDIYYDIANGTMFIAYINKENIIIIAPVLCDEFELTGVNISPEMINVACVELKHKPIKLAGVGYLFAPVRMSDKTIEWLRKSINNTVNKPPLNPLQMIHGGDPIIRNRLLFALMLNPPTIGK